MRAPLAIVIAALALAACTDKASVPVQARSLEFFKANKEIRDNVIALCAKAQGTHAYQPEEECGTALTAKEQVARADLIRERTGGN
jgi:hypothetical protein